MKKCCMIAVVTALLGAGCATETKLEATKPWENHYYNVNDVKKMVEQIQLDKDESIWMMSNHTLNRLLKNAGK